jgi:hypothetical protein
VGLGKKQYLVEELGLGTVELMKTIKRAIDPLGLFNPGKVYCFMCSCLLIELMIWCSYTQTQKMIMRSVQDKRFIVLISILWNTIYLLPVYSC